MTTETPVAPATESAPHITVQDRKVTLVDFCRTAIKINGSDIHLQGGSVPMIRVDGKPKFLDLPPLTDELMQEYVSDIINAQQTRRKSGRFWRKRGSVDLAFPMPDKSAGSAPIFFIAASATRSSCGGS